MIDAYMKLLNMNLLMKRVLHMKLPYTNSLLLVLTAFSHMKDVATINYVGKFLEFFLQVLEFFPRALEFIQKPRSFEDIELVFWKK